MIPCFFILLWQEDFGSCHFHVQKSICTVFLYPFKQDHSPHRIILNQRQYPFKKWGESLQKRILGLYVQPGHLVKFCCLKFFLLSIPDY